MNRTTYLDDEKTIKRRLRAWYVAMACMAFAGSLSAAANAQPIVPGAATAPPLIAPSPPATPSATPTSDPDLVPPQGASPGPSDTPLPSPSPTPPTGRRLAAFHITGDRLTFYSNRFILTANGHVAVKLGDGTLVTGNTLSYDLRLNRLLIAGHIHISAADGEIDGAAFAEYFDFDRAYFLPILSRPDRWTFANGNYDRPLFGRKMPGDTFYLPDLAGERVFLYSKSATVDPKTSVRFAPADINFGLVFAPFPSYFLQYGANPYFAQNALTGAFADGPLDFAGGEHSLITAHVRYDNVDGPFPALEAHEVSDNSYIVASANTLTRPLKQYNLQLYDRISPGLQFQSQLQETAFQSGFSRPLSASGVTNSQLTGSLPHSFLQLNDITYYESLLARPLTHSATGLNGVPVYYYGDPHHNWVPDHPSNVALSWIGYRHPINDLPISFQLRSSVGVATNSITPVQTLGGVHYTKEYDKAIGIDLTTKSFTLLKDPSGRHNDVYFTAVYDRQREWFSLPHHIDQQVVNASLTKIVNPHVTLLASYSNVNTGDFYGAQQTQAYPAVSSYFDPATGQHIPVSPSFRGFGTVRSLAQQLVFVPSQAIALTVAMRENHDFPHAIAGGLQLVGDGFNFVNYGATPLEADFDLRFRISRVLVLDVQRNYYFGFGGYEYWSPGFSFQVEK